MGISIWVGSYNTVKKHLNGDVMITIIKKKLFFFFIVFLVRPIDDDLYPRQNTRHAKARRAHNFVLSGNTYYELFNKTHGRKKKITKCVPT